MSLLHPFNAAKQQFRYENVRVLRKKVVSVTKYLVSVKKGKPLTSSLFLYVCLPCWQLLFR